MDVGQLFVKLELFSSPKNQETVNKFAKNLETLKDKALDFTKQAKIIMETKFSKFFKDSEFASLGFLGKFVDVIGKANLFRIAILGAAAAMVKLSSSAAQSSEHLFKFSLNTGMDTDALQRWQQQAGQAGIQAEEVANSFKQLQQKSLAIQLGQGEPGAFQMAGINVFADTQTQILQIEKMLKNRPAAMGTKLAMDMGLSEEMITFLRMRSALGEPKDNLILSKKEIAELKDFSIKFKGSWYNFTAALTKFGAMIVPITKPFFYFVDRLMKMTVQFTQWLNEIPSRKNVLVATIAGIGLALSAAFFPATVTVAAIAALIATVLIAIEDIATFLRGGDSITGRIWEAIKSKGAAAIVEPIKEAFANLWEWVKENWSYVLKWMWDEVKNFANLILELISKLVGVDIKTPVNEGADYIAASLNNAGDSLKNAYQWIKGLVTTPEVAPLVNPNMINNTTANNPVQNINIQIDGAKNPWDIAETIKRVISNNNSNTMYQMPGTGGY